MYKFKNYTKIILAWPIMGLFFTLIFAPIAKAEMYVTDFNSVIESSQSNLNNLIEENSCTEAANTTDIEWNPASLVPSFTIRAVYGTVNNWNGGPVTVLKCAATCRGAFPDQEQNYYTCMAWCGTVVGLSIDKACEVLESKQYATYKAWFACPSAATKRSHEFARAWNLALCYGRPSTL